MNKFTKLSFLTCLLTVVFLSACKKEYETIQATESATIASYISKNNLSAVMLPDPDKSGFFYQVTSPGTGNNFKNPDSVLYNLTVKSLSTGATYLQSPLSSNLGTFVGYTDQFYNSSLVTTSNPQGFYSIPAIRTALLALKPGGVARILLPSYLAFGRNGAGNIPSNEIVDLIVTTYPYQKQALLDDNRITTFLTSKGLTATKDPSGIYYIVNTLGTGEAVNGIGSTVNVKYTGRTLDGAVFDSSADGISLPLSGLVSGWQVMIPKFKVGTKFRMILPSAYGYGRSGNNAISPNMSLDFDIEIVSVTN
ncbi:FKBP-type peptidyl-prolyl cis-trans isomerase [Pedobacter sp. MC2016-05]|uniref:FKBP-type peptidyl-prolyl cis-trans isomerase n=1 Tax=Pedobacter sp. MC2016-05 TaxID=2994474 RepID=UPI0022479EAF|nr:FKBP-type peptidyl-prolyl cis-trans isomerase [Pedobacter sp. MC2016-05]MCX2474132.1 FKBP-type peptidyl-prolyl cis-trans isomerase [Pedobacter sp. MC2016-05]